MHVSLLIDAHVHLHDCFAPATFLELAHRNFQMAAQRRGWSSAVGVLMLTESEGVDWFGQLARRPTLDPWTIEPTGDRCALMARTNSGQLFLVGGRQVVTREGLEVLLLGTRAMMPDGRPLAEVLAEGTRHGALRVIPWGVGKWLFRRGRVLRDVIGRAQVGDGFFLGDSAGRPFFWPKSSHFRMAERRGIRVLAGTDPLPFPSQVDRAGSFGFRLEAAMDLTNPAAGLKAALLDPASRLTAFGRLERALPFLRNQLAMQRRKRRPPG